MMKFVWKCHALLTVQEDLDILEGKSKGRKMKTHKSILKKTFFHLIHWAGVKIYIKVQISITVFI